MTHVYITRLGLVIRTTNIGSSKIVGFFLKTYGMATAGFSTQDRLVKIRFFKKTFFQDDMSMKAVLRMLFLLLSNVNIQFDAGGLI